MRKHRGSKSCFFSSRVFVFVFLVIAGPVKAAYVFLGDDQATHSSFSSSESDNGCAFTRFFFGE